MSPPSTRRLATYTINLPLGTLRTAELLVVASLLLWLCEVGHPEGNWQRPPRHGRR